jgi:hypothetical protein
MPKPAVPQDVQAQVETIVAEFNRAHWKRRKRLQSAFKRLEPPRRTAPLLFLQNVIVF